MKFRIVGAAFVCVAAVLGATLAEADVETVVVSAERRGIEAPHIIMVKRADHLITKVRVTCDTRDPKLRLDEVKSTLRDMMRAAAGTRTISLGIGDDVIRDLNESQFDEIIEPDQRADTSRAYVVIKTNILPTDTLDSATARIKDFIATVPKAGRSEILREDAWNLTLVGPEQYHDALVSQVLQDAKHTADTLGPNYGIEIEGIEHRVEYYQTGPLDLALFIPYSLKVTPAR